MVVQLLGVGRTILMSHQCDICSCMVSALAIDDGASKDFEVLCREMKFQASVLIMQNHCLCNGQ